MNKRVSVLLVSGLMALFCAFISGRAYAQGWYDAGWAYRMPVSVANPGGTTLTDFQVQIPLTGSFNFAAAKGDGSDIRFTSDNGTTPIPFWIERWDSGAQQARLWARVSSVPPAGTTVFLYYGNASASSQSNGAGTFRLFDDFSDNSVAGANWIRLLSWNGTDWSGYTAHDWKYSMIMQEGALFYSQLRAANGWTIASVDTEMQREFDHMHLNINSNGTVTGLTTANVYEYGVVLSNLGLGYMYFKSGNPTLSARCYDDMVKVYGYIRSQWQTPNNGPDYSIILQGYVNAWKAFNDYGNTVSADEVKTIIQNYVATFRANQSAGGWNGSSGVQDHLKRDFAVMFAYDVTDSASYLTAVKNNIDYILSTYWVSSNGGLTWYGLTSDPFFECHQQWFMIATRMLYDRSGGSHNYLTQGQAAWYFLTDNNYAGFDMYVHNYINHGSFFSYRQVTNTGVYQTDNFKGSYEMGTALWGMALNYSWVSNYQSSHSTQPYNYLDELLKQVKKSPTNKGFYSPGSVVPNTNRWTRVGNPVAQILSDNGNTVLSLAGGGNHNELYASVDRTFNNFILESRVKLTQDLNNQCTPEINFRYTDLNNRYFTMMRGETQNDLFLRRVQGGTNYVNATAAYNFAGNTYYRHKIAANGSAIRISLNDTVRINTTDAGTGILTGGVGLHNYAANYPVYYDDVRVREFADPEPVSTLGAEQIRPPVAPVAIAASAISTSGFTANWNPVGDATGYRLDVATDVAFSNILVAYNDLAVGSTSQTVSGLSPGADYYYRVRAVNAGGTSGNSNTISVTTLGTFTITASAGPNGSITPSGTLVVNYGTTLAFTIAPDPGYHVDSLIVDGIAVDSTVSYTFSNILADHSIRVVFAINQYTITAVAGVHGSITPSGSILVDHGATAAFSITPDPGYHIDSIIVDEIAVDSTSSYTFTNVVAGHSIRAVFALNQYTITASAGPHGSISPSGAIILNHGDTQTFLFAPDPGYHVDSIIVDGTAVDSTTSYTFSNISDDHDIRVVFAIDLYTITSSAGPNGSITPAGPLLVPHGSDQIYTIMPGTGYHIDSLIVDDVSIPVVSIYTFSNVTANHTIRAVFAINRYTITATAGPNGTISPSGDVEVVHGASRTFSFTPNTGYHIDSVFVDGAYIGTPSSYVFTNVISDRTLSVKFEIDTFTITASSGANGSISPSGTIVVNYGSNLAFTITPLTGYYTSSLKIDGVEVDSTTSFTFINITENHTIRADFSLSQYVIIATAGPNGSISPSGSVGIGYGGNQTFTFTPAVGYHVDSIVVDGAYAGSDNSYTFTNVVSNRSIHVTFAINEYTITATAGPNGSITPSGNINILHGESLQFIISADLLYHVDSIIVDGVRVDSTTSYTFTSVSSGHTIRAVFRIDAYPITVTAGPNGGISPSGTTYVDHGSSATFTIVPDKGYLVDSVFVDGLHIGYPGSYTFLNVTSPHTLLARFRADLTLQVFPSSDTIPDGELNVPYNFAFLATGGSPPYAFTRNHPRPDVAFSAAGVLSGTPITPGVDTSLVITVTDSRDAVANRTYRWYVREPLQLTVVGNGSIQRSPDRATYRHGESVTLTAVPGNEQWNFAGWSGGAGGTTNPITITVPDYGSLTAVFVFDTAYLRTYRSVPYEDWARDVDAKGKPRGIKKKPHRVDFDFLVINDMPEATKLIVDFSIPVIEDSMRTTPANSCREVFPKSKRVSFCFSTGLSIGDSVIIHGRGIKGSYQKVSAYYWQRVDPILGPVTSLRKKDATTIINALRLPMPNLHNVGEEMFMRSAFPSGLRVGIPRDAKGAQSVAHPRYRDVLTSLAKKATMHTGQPRCMAGFDNGKTISKLQKSLPFDKHNNILFAAATILKLNITASALNQFPNGFGELTFADPNDPGNPLNGKTISAISMVADSMLSCLTVSSVSPQPTVGQLYNVIDNILRAFVGPVDTIAAMPWTLMKGVRPLMDVNYLHATSGIQPVSIPVPANGPNIPEHFVLEQNYPNPFNPVTTIQFRMQTEGYVTLKVYNILGQEVAVLLDREFMEEGAEEVEFDGAHLASGVYFYRLVVEEQMDDEDPIFLDSFISTRKMILVK